MLPEVPTPMAAHEALVQSIEGQLPQVALLYTRLLVVVGRAGTGKTAALRALARRQGTSPINVSLELSRALLAVDGPSRTLRVMPLLEEIVSQRPAEIVLLDNLELLFEPSLRQNPLRCLQLLARRRAIVATWSGTLDAGDVVYAEPSHHEYQRHRIDGFLVVNTNAAP